MYSLVGRTALITGSGSGIGQSHANILSKAGADIIIHDINAEGVEETARLVEANGRKSFKLVCDVRDVAAMKAGIAEAASTLAPVDILVNNAGIGSQRLSLLDIDEDTYDAMIDINIKGAFFTTQTVIPAMQERKFGRIINTSSIFGLAGNVHGSHYCAGKAGLIGLTRAWAQEFGPDGITVNTVAPGFIPTPMTLRPGDENFRAARCERIPLGHEGETQDISHAVAYLASDEAGYVTGQTISPNGGIVVA